MGNWIKGAIKHPGALHEEMGVPKGEKIPKKRLAKAAKAGGKLGQRARLAETLEGFHHSSQDEAHYDAPKKNGSLHETLVHEDLGAEANRHVHKDPGDHGSGQSLQNSKTPPRNPHGNPGYHHSTQDYEHTGYQHTSKHR